MITALLALGWGASTPEAFAQQQICVTCHSAPHLQTERDGRQLSLHVDVMRYEESEHGRLACTDCHVDLRSARIPHKPRAQPVDCTSCHRAGGPAPAQPVEQYPDSVHGRARAEGNERAPRCHDCHNAHYSVLPTNPTSDVSPANLPNTCGKCHEQASYYRGSVHGQILIQQGERRKVPLCTDCHGVHDIKATTSAASLTQKKLIPAMCGRCHSAVERNYLKGIHGQALMEGAPDAPVCADCHGEHGVRRPSDEASPVSPARVVHTCSTCHESLRIQQAYGLPAHRLASYAGSYHGLAHELGEATVANCASCHGAHAILPSSNPQSSINPSNIPKTCGECHPGASAHFAEGRVHLWPSSSRDRAVFFVRMAYLALIYGLVGAFCAYILLDVATRMRKGADYLKGAADE